MEPSEATWSEIRRPNSKPITTVIMSAHEIPLHEGENMVRIFREGVGSPRPLTDTEHKRLLELRELIHDREVSMEERLRYRREMEQIPKNTPRSGYRESTVTMGKVSPEIMNLPKEERAKRVQILSTKIITNFRETFVTSQVCPEKKWRFYHVSIKLNPLAASISNHHRNRSPHHD